MLQIYILFPESDLELFSLKLMNFLFLDKLIQISKLYLTRFHFYLFLFVWVLLQFLLYLLQNVLSFLLLSLVSFVFLFRLLNTWKRKLLGPLFVWVFGVRKMNCEPAWRLIFIFLRDLISWSLIIHYCCAFGAFPFWR